MPGFRQIYNNLGSDIKRKIMKEEVEIYELNQIRNAVENLTGIKDITVKTRKMEYVISRGIYCKLSRDKTNCSYEKISKVLDMDRVSVLNMLKKTDELLRLKPYYNEIYKELGSIDYSFKKDGSDKESIIELKKELFHLKMRSKNINSEHLKETHKPLVELLNKIPKEHIGTIKMRLEPIIRMLPKETINRDKIYS